MSFAAAPTFQLINEGILQVQDGPHLARARRQAAVVRALLDQVERYMPPSTPQQEVRDQLDEELGRLHSEVRDSQPGLAPSSEE